jgi:dolichol kinase
MTEEEKRKLSHWFILIVPVCYIFFLRKNALLAALGVFFLFVALVEAIRQKNPALNERILKIFKGVYRKEEMYNTSTLIYTLSGMFFTVYLFEKKIALLSILFLTFGDGFAALAGEKWGRHKISAKSKKSWEGAAANLVSCLIVGLIFSRFYRVGGLKVVSGAVAVALIELLPRTKDNIVIPVVSGMVMSII